MLLLPIFCSLLWKVGRGGSCLELNLSGKYINCSQIPLIGIFWMPPFSPPWTCYLSISMKWDVTVWPPKAEKKKICAMCNFFSTCLLCCPNSSLCLQKNCPTIMDDGFFGGTPEELRRPNCANFLRIMGLCERPFVSEIASWLMMMLRPPTSTAGF